MDKNEILEVLSAFSASSATLLHYEKSGIVFTLDKTVQRGGSTVVPAPSYAATPVHTALGYAPVPQPELSAPMIATEPTPPVVTAQPTAQPTTQIETVQPVAAQSSGQGTPVKAQLVGVYYGAPTPDSDPFIKVGQEVKEGDTLCIIEAMKVMNEIKAPKSGRIVNILVESGDLVEFGQVLVEIG